ncbi:hypothetical protein PILCRDRAFT_822350 [Piloderma croceum F 1598]|uniref:Uncharacterized protein n=1 Tax=Piloderma croceum (strain F 1598) TaxID=765440 RepID=A0A0C3FN17_PILCF|nr:hypothetical protein PILCRDRAFT_822350 [Piloderma croceum F 1598]
MDQITQETALSPSVLRIEDIESPRKSFVIFGDEALDKFATIYSVPLCHRRRGISAVWFMQS